MTNKNNQVIKLDVLAQLINNRTMVPLRFVGHMYSELPQQYFETYENLEHGFKIKYPKTWQLLDSNEVELDEGVIVAFVSPQENKTDEFSERNQPYLIPDLYCHSISQFHCQNLGRITYYQQQHIFEYLL